jgi:hypothetical protein
MTLTRTLLVASVALAVSAPSGVLAAEADELAQIRAEIKHLKDGYEARIRDLEKRLEKAEGTRTASVAPAPVTAQPAATANAREAVRDRLGQVGAGSAFNPQISLILDGVVYGDNRQGRGAELAEGIDGIHHSHEHEGHDHGALERGFNLRETELVFSATVSPHFDARMTMTLSSSGEVELEEAYFDTRSLPMGFKLRGGKFLSSIGYLNDKHPHQWDFVDQNLAYRTLVGEHGLSDTGVRLDWLPKTGRWLTRLGVELLQGREQLFGSVDAALPEVRADGAALAGTAAGGLSAAKAGPRLVTAYAKLSPDLGDRHALQFGLWGAWTRQHQEIHDHSLEDPAAALSALEGKGALWGADWVYKYDAGLTGGHGNFSLVGEYLRTHKDLHIVFSESASRVGEARDFTQDGLVLQGTYGFAPYWRAGLRYDATGLTNRLEGPAGMLWNKSRSDRWTFALSRSLTEYSLLRLQASHANLYVDGAPEGLNQLFLQYQHSLGTHGAHSF